MLWTINALALDRAFHKDEYNDTIGDYVSNELKFKCHLI